MPCNPARRSMTPSLRRNIVERGEDLVAELEKLVVGTLYKLNPVDT